jgi:fused signal recognition particle receptor
MPEDEEGIAADSGGEIDRAEAEDEAEDDLRRGMSRSRNLLLRPFRRAATRKAIDPEFWEEAEEALIAADAGVACAADVVESARERIISTGARDLAGLMRAFRDEITGMIMSFGELPPPPVGRPRVIFVVGVNGVGKTTTAAKLGYRLKEGGQTVLFAAADTFRAAGIEQMEMWANRVGAPCVRHKPGGDPAAVVYDAVESAKARETDIVIIDTAGRLHTKTNLMEELKKMWRVAGNQIDHRPEAILVIDATTGQNGISQARLFGEAMDIDSIALTKMDGSAKGGVVLAIGSELSMPVSYVGVGEGMADLKPFVAEEYAGALF